MLFCSYLFFAFLALVLLLVRASEAMPRVQRLVLLLAGNIFYGYWDPRFLLLIWLSICVDFTVGVALDRTLDELRRKRLITLSLLGNLSFLGFFKYFNFFQDGAEKMLGSLGIAYEPWLLKIALPLGISFYTFQTLSYTIDVYGRQMPACRSLLDFAQFIMYFPQLVAGPIERASKLMPQLQGALQVRLPNIMSGGLLILWGCFKKAVIADNAGHYLVNPIFEDPIGGLHLWLGTFAFGIQIYCDFSGYCDIARGASRCLGVELMDNFCAPYFAENIADFWRRWHISLSTWFRDYLYIPLGGNRLGPWKTYRNLGLTMFLCGLWHGAGVNFVVWGIYHGLLMMVHRMLSAGKTEQGSPAPSRKYFCVAGTLLLVAYGWMIFRLEHAGQIIPYTLLMLNPLGHLGDASYRSQAVSMLFTLLVLGAAVLAAHLVQVRASQFGEELEDLPYWRPAYTGVVGGLVTIVLLVFGTLGESFPFIYFQF